MADKIDSNATSFAYAKEASLKTLPATPKWKAMCPNSFSDFGGEISTVARNCINASRQKKKGSVVDNDASGGFNVDFTQNNLLELSQGFFFADAREKTDTQPLNGTTVAMTAVDVDSYSAAAGLGDFKEGDLILATGFSEALNNGIKTVSLATAIDVSVNEALIAEATPAASARIQTVGFEAEAGDLSIVASASSIVLNSVVLDFTTLNLNVGEWIFVGGDEEINQFENNIGYARIKSFSANEIVLDDTTFAAVTETGGIKEIHLYVGIVVRNEKDVSLIKRTSYNFERQLGQDSDGTMSEYLEGAIPNEFTINLPQTDKMNADLSLVALDNSQRNGDEGIKDGDRIDDPNEDVFNTSSDMYRQKLSINDPLDLNNSSLFGFVSEATISITNNVTPTKALGVLGAFEATAGDFEVTGSITAYFSTIEAVRAVRNNYDVGFSVISASQNAGMVFDLPLISLGGGRITVEKDTPVTVPLETNAAENDNGYTMMIVNFPYLPDVAMPTI